MQRNSFIAAVFAVLAPATMAQTVVIPAGTATTEGNSSNAFPWGRGTLGSLEIQTIYDSSNFTSQSINYPILITGLRYRANGTSTSAGGTYGAVSVEMATATVDALTPSTTFAANMAGDLTQVYAGAVTVLPTGAAQSPGIWAVDIPLATSFLYDPSSGNDLVIFSHIPPPATNPITGNPSLQLDVQSTGSLSSRVFNSSTTVYPNATGSITSNHGVVVELTYNPASGLYAGFSATPSAGPVGQTVNFTDTTFTSDPNGVTSWTWDLDGDGTPDSTLQNPSFTYNVCGAYDVTLTVTDGTHAPNTLTRTGYIQIGISPITPSFTFAPLAPSVYQFTDTSTPTPSSWAWDLDGDGTVDSTAQNPVWAYAAPCTAVNVMLSVSSTCAGPWSTTQAVVSAPVSFTTSMVPNNGLSSAGAGNLFDIDVTNPKGVSICALSLYPFTASAAVTCEVYLTDAPGGVAANYNNASVWRLVATGNGSSTGTTTTPSDFALDSPLYLPAGHYGIAISTSVGLRYQTLSAGYVTDVGPDITTTGGRSAGPLFSAGIDNRGFCGTLHYTTFGAGDAAGYGFFGSGCAGSLGVSSLSPNAPPVLGTTMDVTIDKLAANAAIMMTGFSRTSSAFGPLPFDVTPYGAPGCFLRVSPDANLLVLGAGNTAMWSLPIPNAVGLIGVLMFNQAIALDPAFNAASAVASDAHGMMLGL